ncbi:MAG: class I SAM-dependent methyltransferase [Deltaproteobacteria bacterium]|nr:class I SAM-dependent methyltransferase [Deltaproteobacteria bacterium]
MQGVLILSIKKGFDKVAKDYDIERKRLIPCFDDFYGASLELISSQKDDKIKVLDLGAGTGVFAGFVAELYPNAKFTLCDISDKMLDEAKKRFTETSIKVDFLVKDYSKEEIEGRFDLIISALSIHHLTDLEKENLFKKLFKNLNKGGLFVNADQVLGKNKSIDKIYRSMWLKQVKENGVTEEVLDAGLERMKEDKMSTLSDQLDWLKKAKYENVNCWYQNFNFVVYSGSKP